MSGIFVCYEKAAQGLGRITNTASVVEHDAYAAQLDAQGTKYHFVPMDGFTGYLELGADDGVVAIDLRPDFPGKWDKTEIGLMEVATLSSVPVCEVHVSGPQTDATIQHPGGDLQLRFSLPGNYGVWFEAFPAKQMTATFNVAAKVATAQQENS